MNDTEQRIAIAESCGWAKRREHRLSQWLSPHGGAWNEVPDYPNDLNAMHEAEKTLTDDQLITYEGWLIAVSKASRRANAKERCEAFCLTLGLMKP